MNIMAIFIFALIWAIGAAVVALVEYACGEPATTTRDKLLAALRVIGSWFSIAAMWSKFDNNHNDHNDHNDNYSKKRH